VDYSSLGGIRGSCIASCDSSSRARLTRTCGGTRVQLVVTTVRQGEHPLPHGRVGEYVIEKMGRALGHPEPAAPWTQRPRLTGNRNRPIEAAVATAKPREPAGEPAIAKKLTKFLLDEAGQAFSVAETGGLSTKGLEVIVDELIGAPCPGQRGS
jgi:hypothetical protein